MPTIYLTTEMNAPIERCFNLSLSVDFHMASTSKSQEKAIAGVTSGLLALGDTVTWRAKHFGVWQNLTVQITELNRPYYFKDEMLKGTFQSLIHSHYFEEKDGNTLMKDEFMFNSPLGVLGNIADALFLEHYMASFLQMRNAELKSALESNVWKRFLMQS